RAPPRSHFFPYTTLFRSIPRPVVTILEGESLVNDATGLVIYKFATPTNSRLACHSENIPVSTAAIGGIVIGFLMGQAFVIVHKRSEEHTSELQSLTHLVC